MRGAKARGSLIHIASPRSERSVASVERGEGEGEVEVGKE